MSLKYSDIVDYDKLDPFKEESIRRLRRTWDNVKWFGISIVEESIGETAVALDMGKLGDFHLAFNVEGLGTKNKIAEEMATLENTIPRRLFSGLGQCVMAMSINDLSSIGAKPIIYEPIVATGDSNYLADSERSAGIIDGFLKGADISGVAIPGGETPTLRGIISRDTMDLAGASLGYIAPKSRLTLGERLTEGLTIYGISSSGIHANGLSLARKISEKLPEGYFTRLPNNKTLGETLLTPTIIYSGFINSLFENHVDAIYIQPITGHGFGKIMRKKKNLKYIIENLPEPQPEFKFLQEKGPVSDEEAYKTWNMGVGLVIFAKNSDSSKIRHAARENNLQVYELGQIEKGQRQVVLTQKNIIYRPK